VKVLYTAEATATGDGRNGHVTTSDRMIDADVIAPKELGGAGGATNPEQLFAAGYAACFHSALRRVAKAAGADVTGSQVTARVGIGAITPTSFGLTVALDVALPAVPRAEGEKVVEAAHQVCPYSNATRGNIDVVLTVVDCVEVTA
jgi:osmotically inducible protein OsmC